MEPDWLSVLRGKTRTLFCLPHEQGHCVHAMRPGFVLRRKLWAVCASTTRAEKEVVKRENRSRLVTSIYVAPSRRSRLGQEMVIMHHQELACGAPDMNSKKATRRNPYLCSARSANGRFNSRLSQREEQSHCQCNLKIMQAHHKRLAGGGTTSTSVRGQHNAAGPPARGNQGEGPLRQVSERTPMPRRSRTCPLLLGYRARFSTLLKVFSLPLKSLLLSFLLP